MSQTRFEVFNKTCESQGVGLDSGWLEEVAGYGDGQKNRWSGTPNSMLGAIFEAGNFLRRHENLPLADIKIDPKIDFDADVQTQALIRIINASIKPEQSLPGELAFFLKPAEPVDICSYA